MDMPNINDDILAAITNVKGTTDLLADAVARVEAKLAAMEPPVTPPDPDPPVDPPVDPPIDPPTPTNAHQVYTALYGTAWKPPAHPNIDYLPMVFQSTPFPGGGYSLTEADIDRTAARYPDADRICVDVEHVYPWRLDVDPSSTALVEMLMEGLQERRPSVDWGIYGLPVRSYWSQNAAWRAQGDHVRGVLQHCDTIYPSIYTFRGLPITEEYIGGMVREAVRLAGGKPVLPFHWPVQHGNGQAHGNPLSAAEFDQVTGWALQAGADGIVVWGDDYGPLNDGGPGGWWQQVQELAAIPA